ncbi:cytochrome P450 4V2-like [Brevipalpus obovatus]|uniref:cytochrome P450 4V2-like n=1 Tax=Brevipalpus obovatus TaxID=246614 RepID=UPI003D9DFCE2
MSSPLLQSFSTNFAYQVIFSIIIIYLLINLSKILYVVWFYQNYPSRKTNSLFGEMLNLNPNFPFINKSNEAPIHKIASQYVYTEKMTGAPILWVATIPYIMINTYKTAQILIKGRNNPNKPWTYRYLDPRLFHGLIGVNGKKWADRRRLYLPAFRKRNLVNYFDNMAEMMESVVETIKNRANNDRHEFRFDNIKTPVHMLVLDVLGSFVLGKRLDNFHNSDSAQAQASINVGKPIMHRATNPILRIDLIFNNLPLGKKLSSCIACLSSFYKEIIDSEVQRKFGPLDGDSQYKEEHIENFSSDLNDNATELSASREFKTLLSTFLDGVYEGGIGIDNSELDLSDVRDEIANSMSAGIETTTNATIWTLYLLGLHQSEQEKVFDEVSHWNPATSSYDVEQNLRNSPFLEQCIKEAMRLFPPVPIIARELAEDTILEGRKYLKGTEVCISSFLIHRDPQVFEEAEKFQPERFDLHAKPFPPFSYIPFSMGARDCVGKSLAMFSLKLMIGTLVKNFQLTSLKPLDEIPVELTMTSEPMSDLPMIFKIR